MYFFVNKKIEYSYDYRLIYEIIYKMNTIDNIANYVFSTDDIIIEIIQWLDMDDLLMMRYINNKINNKSENYIYRNYYFDFMKLMSYVNNERYNYKFKNMKNIMNFYITPPYQNIIKLLNKYFFGVNKLKFDGLFNQSIDVFIMCFSKLTHLYLGNNFNVPINILPDTTKYIKFGKSFNSKLNYIPHSLIQFNIKSDIAPPIEQLNNITHLILTRTLNQHINQLPYSLKKLKLKLMVDNMSINNFNQMINNLSKLSSLTYLSIIMMSTSKFVLNPISGLSNSLSVLKINCDLQILNLPTSLVELRLDDYYDNIKCKLPINLKKLILTPVYNEANEFNTALIWLSELTNLVHLVCSYNRLMEVVILPKCITLLKIYRCNIMDYNIKRYVFRTLPIMLEQLFIIGTPKIGFKKNDVDIIIDNKLNHCLYNLKHLNELYLQHISNDHLNYLPDTIESLYLIDYDAPITKLPRYLKNLVLGNKFDQPIHEFPISLEKLIIGDKFNKDLINLPDTLKILELTGKFECDIIFPNKLIELTIYDKYIFKSPFYFNYIEIGGYCDECVSYYKKHNKSFELDKNIALKYPEIFNNYIMYYVNR